MGTTWYPNDDVEIDVADPGSGRIGVHRVEDRDPQAKLTERILAGHEIGQTLRALTAAATADASSAGRHDVDGLWPMTSGQARDLLPSFQMAVLVAAAGSDRAERIYDPPDPDEPRRPICDNCDEGRRDSAASPHPNPWCERYGHSPFGEPASNKGAWERAQRRYAEHRAALEHVSYLPARR